MLIVEGPAGNGIGRAIASKLGLELLECEHRIFPDGESEVGIKGSVKDKDILIVQTTYPQQDKSLMELLFLADDARKQGARSIGAVVSYLAYDRQDGKFEGKNNTVSIETVLWLMNSVGITSLATVTPHKENSLSTFNGVVEVVYATGPLAEEVKMDLGDVNASDLLVLAPDKGALHIAKGFAEVIGCDYKYIEKQRDRISGDIKLVKAPADDFRGKVVVVVDDVISTGGTIAQAAAFAFNAGASKVVVAATHLVMAGDAYEKIKKSGVSEIYGTNTIPYSKAHMVDISKAIAEVVHEKSLKSRMKRT